MLHTVNKSPFQSNNLKNCSRYIKSGDALLLLEDGVYAAMQGTEESSLVEALLGNGVSVYAISADLNMRSVSQPIEGVTAVDYAGFVDLVEEHPLHSWL